MRQGEKIRVPQGVSTLFSWHFPWLVDKFGTSKAVLFHDLVYHAHPHKEIMNTQDVHLFRACVGRAWPSIAEPGQGYLQRACKKHSGKQTAKVPDARRSLYQLVSWTPVVAGLVQGLTQGVHLSQFHEASSIE